LRLVLVRVEDDLLDAARVVLDGVVEAGERLPLRFRVVVHERLGPQPDDQRDDNDGEERAAEETVHKFSIGRVSAPLQPNDGAAGLVTGLRPGPVLPRTADSCSARRNRGRTRSRTRWGSRS